MAKYILNLDTTTSCVPVHKATVIERGPQPAPTIPSIVVKYTDDGIEYTSTLQISSQAALAQFTGLEVLHFRKLKVGAIIEFADAHESHKYTEPLGNTFKSVQLIYIQSQNFKVMAKNCAVINGKQKAKIDKILDEFRYVDMRLDMLAARQSQTVVNNLMGARSRVRTARIQAVKDYIANGK